MLHETENELQETFHETNGNTEKRREEIEKNRKEKEEEREKDKEKEINKNKYKEQDTEDRVDKTLEKMM
nr:MAG TPA: hypothetical protein [Caudoviricetes sp.]